MVNNDREILAEPARIDPETNQFPSDVNSGRPQGMDAEPDWLTLDYVFSASSRFAETGCRVGSRQPADRYWQGIANRPNYDAYARNIRKGLAYSKLVSRRFPPHEAMLILRDTCPDSP